MKISYTIYEKVTKGGAITYMVKAKFEKKLWIIPYSYTMWMLQFNHRESRFHFFENENIATVRSEFYSLEDAKSTANIVIERYLDEKQKEKNAETKSFKPL